MAADRTGSGPARAHVHVTGKVQGVFYRATTKETAEGLGLAGWVKNLPDGRVEAVFEGPRQRVEQAVAWCHDGSPAARVEDVDVAWEEPKGVDGFSIRR